MKTTKTTKKVEEKEEVKAESSEKMALRELIARYAKESPEKYAIKKDLLEKQLKTLK